MHAGLLRPDSAPAPALAEARQVADEIEAFAEVGTTNAKVALVFDYESAWGWDAQPQGADFEMFRLAFAAYCALRRAGLSIDILPPDTADLSGYKLVLAPGIMCLSDPLRTAMAAFKGTALIGPRTDTKTNEISIPTPLGPNITGLDVSVALTESMPPDDAITLENGGQFLHWFEHLEGSAAVLEKSTNGHPAIMGDHNLRYLAGWPDPATFDRIIADLCAHCDLARTALPEGLRIRDTATHRFVFNYANHTQDWNGTTIPAAGVHWEPLS
jgi:beta-galactosidase